jgi:hypothetical protein
MQKPIYKRNRVILGKGIDASTTANTTVAAECEPPNCSDGQEDTAAQQQQRSSTAASTDSDESADTFINANEVRKCYCYPTVFSYSVCVDYGSSASRTAT